MNGVGVVVRVGGREKELLELWEEEEGWGRAGQTDPDAARPFSTSTMDEDVRWCWWVWRGAFTIGLEMGAGVDDELEAFGIDHVWRGDGGGGGAGEGMRWMDWEWRGDLVGGVGGKGVVKEEEVVSRRRETLEVDWREAREVKEASIGKGWWEGVDDEEVMGPKSSNEEESTNADDEEAEGRMRAESKSPKSSKEEEGCDWCDDGVRFDADDDRSKGVRVEAAMGEENATGGLAEGCFGAVGAAEAVRKSSQSSKPAVAFEARAGAGCDEEEGGGKTGIEEDGKLEDAVVGEMAVAGEKDPPKSRKSISFDAEEVEGGRGRFWGAIIEAGLALVGAGAPAGGGAKGFGRATSFLPADNAANEPPPGTPLAKKSRSASAPPPASAPSTSSRKEKSSEESWSSCFPSREARAAGLRDHRLRKRETAEGAAAVEGEGGAALEAASRASRAGEEGGGGRERTSVGKGFDGLEDGTSKDEGRGDEVRLTSMEVRVEAGRGKEDGLVLMLGVGDRNEAVGEIAAEAPSAVAEAATTCCVPLICTPGPIELLFLPKKLSSPPLAGISSPPALTSASAVPPGSPSMLRSAQPEGKPKPPSSVEAEREGRPDES
jgi:hypothetical protein